MQFGQKWGDCGERKKWSVVTNIGVKRSQTHSCRRSLLFSPKRDRVIRSVMSATL